MAARSAASRFVRSNCSLPSAQRRQTSGARKRCAIGCRRGSCCGRRSALVGRLRSVTPGHRYAFHPLPRDKQRHTGLIRLQLLHNGIGESDPPNVVLQLRGLQIGTPFAEYDRDLAVVVQAIAPFGIDELTIGTDDLASELPKSPETGVADLPGR